MLAALVLTVFITAPAGASTAGGIGLRLLDAPTSAGDDPRARLYIVDHLAPGTVIHRRIEVSNTTASPMHIVLYPAAATIEDGSFLGAAGHSQNDLSTWTSVDPGASDVLADGRATATVTINVPDDAAPGEQYGVVWAEARSAPTDGSGVTLITRVGIRIYLSVGPGGPPAADFTIDSLTAERSPDGQPTVLATVHNTGGRALDMSGTLKLLAGPGGLGAGPFPADLGTTLPVGGTESVVIILDEALPAGPWDARIALRSGLLVRSARATITLPGRRNSAVGQHGPHPPGMGVSRHHGSRRRVARGHRGPAPGAHASSAGRGSSARGTTNRGRGAGVGRHRQAGRPRQVNR